MSENLRNEAEALAASLEIGAVSVADVVAWAHSVIEAEEQPHWSVCELATMGSSDKPNVVGALREVPGAIDHDWVRGRVVHRLAQGLAEDRTRADRIASALYRLAQADELPDRKLQSLAWWASDALDLADDGLIPETRDEVIDQMLAALTEAAEAGAPIQRPF
ncbi:hypothetical protein AKJ09_06803 [Labilithrix luteola]|uniref:Uncharacterized protein n=1 Tax=Labilithrix luteola TaxID=1391654 RepID=A0A0K1Q429_9BACT|nr:hypothetical protein [Labilithrix luteola]AKV00140.1 hypothetical protein AKJ09_06803 [Labilithrix luteola]